MFVRKAPHPAAWRQRGRLLAPSTSGCCCSPAPSAAPGARQEEKTGMDEWRGHPKRDSCHLPNTHGAGPGGLAQGCAPAQSPSLPAGSGVRAALSCPEVLGQLCSPGCCTLAPVPPAGVPRDLPRAAQAGHFGFILDCLGQPSCPCAGATRGVLISKSEVKISPDPNRARMQPVRARRLMLLPGPSQPATAPGRDLGDSRLDGRGEQPLCHGALCPRTRAALGDPQPSLGALRAARSSSARHKPSNCQEQTQSVSQLPQASAPGAPRPSPALLGALSTHTPELGGHRHRARGAPQSLAG